MTDPDRLEKALPDLLRRSGWTGPEAIPSAAVPPEEQQRWEQLFEEPAEPVRRRFAFSALGATGLVAAALVAAVSFRTVIQSSQLKTAPSQTAAQKRFTAMRPKSKEMIRPELLIPERKIQKQPLLPSQSAPKTSTSLGRSLSESTSASEPASTFQKDKETKAQKPASSLQPNEEVVTKRRAGVQDSTIASKLETKKDKAPITDQQEDPEDLSDVEVRAAPKSASSPTPAGAISQSSSRLLLVSATGLDDTVRDRFQQQLNRTRIQAAATGEAVFDLKLHDGSISEATFIENSSSLKDAVVIETLKQTLQEIKIPQAADISTRITVRIK